MAFQLTGYRVKWKQLYMQEGHRLISEQATFSKLFNKQPRFRKIRNYRSPQFFSLINIVYVWIDLKINSPTYNCAQRKYFRAAFILETDYNRLGLSEYPMKHVGHMGNRTKKQLPVCCRHGRLYPK